MPTEGEMHPNFAAIRSKPFMRPEKPPTEEPKGEIPKIVETVSVGYLRGEGWFNFCPCGRRTPCTSQPELTWEDILVAAKKHGLKITIGSDDEPEEEAERAKGCL